MGRGGRQGKRQRHLQTCLTTWSFPPAGGPGAWTRILAHCNVCPTWCATTWPLKVTIFWLGVSNWHSTTWSPLFETFKIFSFSQEIFSQQERLQLGSSPFMPSTGWWDVFIASLIPEATSECAVSIQESTVAGWLGCVCTTGTGSEGATCELLEHLLDGCCGGLLC